MSKYTRRFGTPIVIAAFTVFAACSSDAKKGPDSVALGADSTLNKDLALASRDSTAQPQLKDVPAAERAVDGKEERSGSDDAARADASRAAEDDSACHDDHAEWQHGDDESENRRCEARTGGGAVGMIPAGATLTTNALVEDLHGTRTRSATT